MTIASGPKPGGVSHSRVFLYAHTIDPDEAVTFGFFDGSLGGWEASQREMGSQERRNAIEPLVEEVIAMASTTWWRAESRRRGHALGRALMPLGGHIIPGPKESP